MAKLVWSVIQNTFHLEEIPNSIKDLSEGWLMGKGPLPIRMTLFLFACFAWAMWTSRNKMAIEHVYPNKSTDVVYVALSLMQKWSALLREDDNLRACAVKDEILSWMRAFQPSNLSASDVYEL